MLGQCQSKISITKWNQWDLSRIIVLVRVGRCTSDVREGIGVLEKTPRGPGIAVTVPGQGGVEAKKGHGLGWERGGMKEWDTVVVNDGGGEEKRRRVGWLRLGSLVASGRNGLRQATMAGGRLKGLHLYSTLPSWNHNRLTIDLVKFN
jgi:hypothetical protein